jgi:hypothetical protein
VSGAGRSEIGGWGAVKGGAVMRTARKPLPAEAERGWVATARGSNSAGAQLRIAVACGFGTWQRRGAQTRLVGRWGVAARTVAVGTGRRSGRHLYGAAWHGSAALAGGVGRGAWRQVGDVTRQMVPAPASAPLTSAPR